MNVLIDTNIALDVLLQRELFFEDSQLVLLAAEQKYINGFISASAVTDIFYITNRALRDKSATYSLLREHLMGTVGIATVDGSHISKALDLEWDDFEDCVHFTVGESVAADYIVTRNPKDYDEGQIKAITPGELLDVIAPIEFLARVSEAESKNVPLF